MEPRRLLSLLLGAALPVLACQGPAHTSAITPGEPFATVRLTFET